MPFSEGSKVVEEAAIVHDLLWREYARTGRISYHDADGMFRRAMRELDVPFLRRWHRRGRRHA